MPGSDQGLSWRHEKEAGSERDVIRVAWRTAPAEAFSWIKEFVQDISQHKMHGLCSQASEGVSLQSERRSLMKATDPEQEGQNTKETRGCKSVTSS